MRTNRNQLTSFISGVTSVAEIPMICFKNTNDGQTLKDMILFILSLLYTFDDIDGSLMESSPDADGWWLSKQPQRPTPIQKGKTYLLPHSTNLHPVMSSRLSPQVGRDGLPWGNLFFILVIGFENKRKTVFNMGLKPFACHSAKRKLALGWFELAKCLSELKNGDLAN